MKNFTVERNGLVYLFIESTTARLVLQTTYDLSTLKNSDYGLRCSLARYKDHRPFSIVVYINTCCIHITICRPPPARYYNETNSYCCNSFHTNTIGSGSDFNPQLDGSVMNQNPARCTFKNKLDADHYVTYSVRCNPPSPLPSLHR